MPIAESTVVKRRVGKNSEDAKKRHRAEEKRVEEEHSSLFSFKESKYHDDLLNRESRKD